jgi:pimeloyl-ACP methyl ester carboxylesterase
MDSRQSKPPLQATLHSCRLTMSDGVALAATVSGQPGQPAVILLHGGGQTRHSWQGTVKTLGALGYHALAFDARGHGDSDWSAKPDYSYDRLAEDL